MAHPASGSRPSVVLGYTDQDMSQLPDKGATRQLHLDPLRHPGRTACGASLAGAGFPMEKQGRPIAQLSLGQRARLGLLALRLTEPNFYLMDEPTNHVDIPGREALERKSWSTRRPGCWSRTIEAS